MSIQTRAQKRQKAAGGIPQFHATADDKENVPSQPVLASAAQDEVPTPLKVGSKRPEASAAPVLADAAADEQGQEVKYNELELLYLGRFQVESRDKISHTTSAEVGSAEDEDAGNEVPQPKIEIHDDKNAVVRHKGPSLSDADPVMALKTAMNKQRKRKVAEVQRIDADFVRLHRDEKNEERVRALRPWYEEVKRRINPDMIPKAVGVQLQKAFECLFPNINRVQAMRAKRAKSDLASQIHAAGRQNRRPAPPLPEGVWRQPVEAVSQEHRRRSVESGKLSLIDGLGCTACGDRPLAEDLDGDNLLWAQSFLRCATCGFNWCVLCRANTLCEESSAMRSCDHATAGGGVAQSPRFFHHKLAVLEIFSFVELHALSGAQAVSRYS